MDVMDLSWRPTGLNVLVPQVLISCRLMDSQTQQTVIEDLRESQSRQVLFPNIVASLTGAERSQLMQAIVNELLAIYRQRHGG